MGVSGELREDFRARHTPEQDPLLCVCANGAPHSLWVNYHALLGSHSAGRPLSFPCLPPFGSHLSHPPVTWWARGGLDGAVEMPVSASGCSRVQPHWVLWVGSSFTGDLRLSANGRCG